MSIKSTENPNLTQDVSLTSQAWLGRFQIQLGKRSYRRHPGQASLSAPVPRTVSPQGARSREGSQPSSGASAMSLVLGT